MSFSEAARSGRAIMLMRYDAEAKQTYPKSGWLEMLPNGSLQDRETGSNYYPSRDEMLSDLWKTEEESVKLTSKQVIDIFKAYLFGAIKKEVITLQDGVSPHDLAEDFVRKFGFKELPELAEKQNEF